MSSRGESRRALAEIDWGKNPAAIVWVGGRSLHQYWSLLAPYFRDILLTPQRRSEAKVVAWSWHERADAGAPTSSELATLRKRLANDHRSFADHVERGGLRADAFGGAKNQAGMEELAEAVDAMIVGLTARSDGELAGFSHGGGPRLPRPARARPAHHRCVSQPMLGAAPRRRCQPSLRAA